MVESKIQGKATFSPEKALENSKNGECLLRQRERDTYVTVMWLRIVIWKGVYGCEEAFVTGVLVYKDSGGSHVGAVTRLMFTSQGLPAAATSCSTAAALHFNH